MDSLSAAGKQSTASFGISWKHDQMHQGCRQHSSLSLAAGTGDTSHHSTSGTAFYAYLHQCWLRYFSSIFLGFPVFSLRKTVSSGDCLKPLKICIMQSTCLSFSIQYEQNLGDIAHNIETSFKFLKLKKNGCWFNYTQWERLQTQPLENTGEA